MLFALEAASGEPGERVNGAKIVERIGQKSFAENIGTHFGNDGADLGGTDLLGGLKSVDGIGAGNHLQSAFLTEEAQSKEALLA